jgi:hypothetical protein
LEHRLRKFVYLTRIIGAAWKVPLKNPKETEIGGARFHWTVILTVIGGRVGVKRSEKTTAWVLGVIAGRRERERGQLNKSPHLCKTGVASMKEELKTTWLQEENLGSLFDVLLQIGGQIQIVEKLTLTIVVIANGAPGGAQRTKRGSFVGQGMYMTRKWLTLVGIISVMSQPSVVVGIMSGIETGI